MINQNYKDIRTIAHVLLQSRVSEKAVSLTSQQIRQDVEAAVEFRQAHDVDIDALVADLEASFQTVIGRERFLSGDREGYDPWLSNRTGSISWQFWGRYEQFLAHEKKWPSATLRRLDESTDRVLGMLTDPAQAEAWDRRGLVMGHVQSGKTSHYVGLICKAADAGYKLIIVLAGFHKSLRSQTQIRLEEGFLGYDRGATQTSPDAPIKPVGAGLLDVAPKADSITTRADNGDFKRQVANNFAINPGGHPLLFVIKKNHSVLKNLLNWVDWAANTRDEEGNRYVTGVPLLVVDDEADQGSIDTQRQEYDESGRADPNHDPTAINRSIRRILHLFDQSAYVGYTATPFANIFIHEKNETPSEGADLFPRSFIMSLPSPSNYVGPERVFGSRRDDDKSLGLPIIRTVTDHAHSLALGERSGWMPPKHDKLHGPRYEGRDSVSAFASGGGFSRSYSRLRLASRGDRTLSTTRCWCTLPGSLWSSSKWLSRSEPCSPRRRGDSGSATATLHISCTMSCENSGKQILLPPPSRWIKRFQISACPSNSGRRSGPTSGKPRSRFASVRSMAWQERSWTTSSTRRQAST